MMYKQHNILYLAMLFFSSKTYVDIIEPVNIQCTFGSLFQTFTNYTSLCVHNKYIILEKLCQEIA